MVTAAAADCQRCLTFLHLLVIHRAKTRGFLTGPLPNILPKPACFNENVCVCVCQRAKFGAKARTLIYLTALLLLCTPKYREVATNMRRTSARLRARTVHCALSSSLCLEPSSTCQVSSLKLSCAAIQWSSCRII